MVGCSERLDLVCLRYHDKYNHGKFYVLVDIMDTASSYRRDVILEKKTSIYKIYIIQKILSSIYSIHGRIDGE